MLIEIRHATAEDIARVLHFYAERRYDGEIRPKDAVLLAAHDGEMVGIVRLTAEEGVVVLRGMQVHPKFQCRGVGKRLLATVVQELDGRDCFCIPYAHLVGFYAGIGFRPIEPAKAPTFLRLRLKRYQDRGDGIEYLIMRREGVQEASSQIYAHPSRIS